MTSREWDAAIGARQAEILAERGGIATGYMHLLMLQPDRFNFVNMSWLWV